MLFCLLESHAHQKSIAQKMFHGCAPRDDSSSLVSLPLVTKVSFQNWQENSTQKSHYKFTKNIQPNSYQIFLKSVSVLVDNWSKEKAYCFDGLEWFYYEAKSSRALSTSHVQCRHTGARAQSRRDVTGCPPAFYFTSTVYIPVFLLEHFDDGIGRDIFYVAYLFG